MRVGLENYARRREACIRHRGGEVGNGTYPVKESGKEGKLSTWRVAAEDPLAPKRLASLLFLANTFNF